MTTYWVGDQPAEPVVVVPAREGDEVALSASDSATATLLDGSGVERTCPVAIVPDTEDEAGHLEVTLPALQTAGLAALLVTLQTTDGKRDTFEAEPIVVQARTRWHSLGSARLEWEGACALADAALWDLLEVARIECQDYGRVLEPDSPRWTSYRRAQLTHARNRNAAARVDAASGDGGTESYALGAFPLDWTVKQTLRPVRRRPGVR